VKKIKAKVVLWFLHLFDYRLSSKAKKNVLISLAVAVVLGFLGFITHNIIQSHNEGAKLQRDTEVAKSAKEVVSNYADETCAKEHLSLTISQWKAKDNNFDYSLAKTYMTYLASVEDSASAERAYKALPWVSSEIGDSLLSWSEDYAPSVDRLVNLKTLSRVYSVGGSDKWFALFDVSATNKVGTRVESLVSVELSVQDGKVTYWKIEHGGLR
jgi:hypothetical protein